MDNVPRGTYRQNSKCSTWNISQLFTPYLTVSRSIYN